MRTGIQRSCSMVSRVRESLGGWTSQRSRAKTKLPIARCNKKAAAFPSNHQIQNGSDLLLQLRSKKRDTELRKLIQAPKGDSFMSGFSSSPVSFPTVTVSRCVAQMFSGKKRDFLIFHVRTEKGNVGSTAPTSISQKFWTRKLQIGRAHV